MNYITCISIAEKTPKKMQKTLQYALKKSDYAELRLDFLKPEHVPKTLELVKKNLKRVICTLRPKSEGGVFSGTEKERIAIIKLVAEYNPFLLDVEFNTMKKNKEFVKFLKQSRTNVLVSWHDFRKTPKLHHLRKKFAEMKKFSNNIKIVTTAKSTNDSTTVLRLYNKKNDSDLIAFSMGDAGRMSRILCLYLGSPYTYVSLGKAVAPGQFSVDTIKAISKIREN